VSRREIEPSAIQVQTDFTITGPLRDALHFVVIESLAGLAPDRRFDLNGPDWNGYASRGTARGCALQLVHAERRAARATTDEIEPAQGLTTIPAIVIEMAFLLHYDTPLIAGQKPNSQMICKRSSGYPDGHFFAKIRRHSLLQLCHHAPDRIFVRL